MSTTYEEELLHACRTGDTHKVGVLISRTPQTNINCQDENGKTPLFLASAEGHVDIVRKLLTAEGIDAQIPNNNGYQPLHTAAEDGHVKVISLLLSHGVPIDVRQEPSGDTPICLAVGAGELNTVKWLANKGADYNATCIRDTSLLHVASLSGHGHIITYLLMLGLNKDGQASLGLTSLALASSSGQLSSIIVLLEAGADAQLCGEDDYTPLHCAAKEGHPDCLSALIPVSDVNKQNNNGESALMLASQSGHSACVRTLLDVKCDTTLVTPLDNTALHIAAMNGHADCLSLLIPVSDVNKQDKHGFTPLHWAAQHGHSECLSLLIPVSDVNKQAAGCHGYTPLIHAVSYGTAAGAELLLEAGADPEIPSQSKFTALEHAASEGKCECVRLLLKYGAVIRSTDSYSPVKLAMKAGHDEIAHLLQSFQTGYDTMAEMSALTDSPKMTAIVDQSIDLGQNATLTVAVFGKPKPNVIWYAGGVKIVSSDKCVLSNVGRRHSLTLKETRSIHNNGLTVSVVARNIFGEANSKAQIIIKSGNVGPEVDSLQSMKSSEGSDVTFETTVRGIPTPDVKWRHSGNDITPNRKYSVEVFSERHKLTIRQAEPSDSGTITLSAVNASGTKLETAELTVIGKLSAAAGTAKPKWAGLVPATRTSKPITKSFDNTAEHPYVRKVKTQPAVVHVFDICKRFLEDQKLSEDYFDHRFDVCFCVRCHTKKGDELMYTRGDPPQSYGLPIGWCKFGLATKPQAKAKDIFTNWHVAFHGTKAECLDKIIDTGDFLMPGDVTPDGVRLKIPTNHWDPENPHMLPPEGHNVTKFFFSPSIKYSGCDVYAPKQRWVDPATNLIHDVRVAFQVRIQPGTYDVGEQTIGAKGTIDPLFSNDQLEWSTARRGVTILVGLLINIDDVVGDSASEMIRGLKLTDTPSLQSGGDSSYPAVLEFQYIYKSRDGKPIVLNSGDKCLVLGEREDICTIVHPAVNEHFKVPHHYVKKL